MTRLTPKDVLSWLEEDIQKPGAVQLLADAAALLNTTMYTNGEKLAVVVALLSGLLRSMPNDKDRATVLAVIAIMLIKKPQEQ